MIPSLPLSVVLTIINPEDLTFCLTLYFDPERYGFFISDWTYLSRKTNKSFHIPHGHKTQSTHHTSFNGQNKVFFMTVLVNNLIVSEFQSVIKFGITMYLRTKKKEPQQKEFCRYLDLSKDKNSDSHGPCNLPKGIRNSSFQDAKKTLLITGKNETGESRQVIFDRRVKERVRIRREGVERKSTRHPLIPRVLRRRHQSCHVSRTSTMGTSVFLSTTTI